MELNRRQILKLAGLGIALPAASPLLSACSNDKSGGGSGDGSVKFEGWDPMCSSRSGSTANC